MTGTRSGPIQLTVPANTFQTVTLNLGDTNLTGLFDPLGKTWQLAWQMNSAQWGGDGSSQALTIDNVLLSLVPKVIAPVRLESFPLTGWDSRSLSSPVRQGRATSFNRPQIYWIGSQ